MSLNIISYGGGSGYRRKRKISDEEYSSQLANENDARLAESNAGYMKRQLQHRKQFEGKDFSKSPMRPVSTIDAQTYFAHEMKNKGCMSDPDYHRDFVKSNPECKIGNE
jgi:hypothetical protein